MWRWLRRFFAPPEPRWIRAKYDSACVACGEAVVVGDSVYWLPGRGVYCRGCWTVA